MEENTALSKTPELETSAGSLAISSSIMAHIRDK
jgi:hypothetical protein